jgi:hypothetical protein
MRAGLGWGLTLSLEQPFDVVGIINSGVLEIG